VLLNGGAGIQGMIVAQITGLQERARMLVLALLEQVRGTEIEGERKRDERREKRRERNDVFMLLANNLKL
jgi:hypothetical protein